MAPADHETKNNGAPYENAGTLATDAILNRLKTARELDSFIGENESAFYSGTVREHFDMLLAKYGISKADAIARSNIERGYAYQILRGAKDARRDKYLRLAVGIGLDLEDTQRLLTVARHGVLYPKILRDAVVIFAINNRLDIIQTELLLEEQRAEPLG